MAELVIINMPSTIITLVGWVSTVLAVLLHSRKEYTGCSIDSPFLSAIKCCSKREKSIELG